MVDPNGVDPETCEHNFEEEKRTERGKVTYIFFICKICGAPDLKIERN
jgi:hypothetical protein